MYCRIGFIIDNQINSTNCLLTFEQTSRNNKSRGVGIVVLTISYQYIDRHNNR